MNEFDHWHPVLDSSALKKKPIQIELHGKKIVLFRNSENQISALDDTCPHRRMPLSQGKIVEDKIQCAYHGYRFDKNGNGFSKENECKFETQSYDCFEKHNTIWIKPKNSYSAFPYFDTEGYHEIDISNHIIHSPLELVLDNFTEVEHTPDVHLFLGYDSTKMNEVKVETETTNETVRIKNTGPQKKISSIIRFFLEIKKGDLFVDDWTSFFSPVYTVYDQYWLSPVNIEREYKFKIYVFFTPINSQITKLTAFTFFKYPKFGHLGLNLLIKPFLKQIVNLEIKRDKKALEKIEDKNTSVVGMKLTRFDKSLGPNRARLKKIYRQVE